jgi:lysophospholipase L1-like esterase
VAAGSALVAALLVLLGAPRMRSGPEPHVARSDEHFTVYLLGGSTAHGWPYFPRVNLGKLLRLAVGGRIDGYPVRVVNRAGPGKTARVVLRDARQLAGEAPPPERTLVLLYAGNNEFTRFDRRHDLRRVERGLFDEPVVSDGERARVAARYAADLDAIVGVLQDAGIALVASTAAVNLKDWEPNRSVLDVPALADTVRALLERGERAFAGGDYGAARRRFEAVLERTPRFALASKRAGDSCRALGQAAAARRHYRDAIDHDGNPLRETTPLDAALRGVCERRRVPLLDAGAVLDAASPDGLLGWELLWDNCHPTLDGYRLLGEALAAIVDSLYEVTPRAIPDSLVRAVLKVDAEFERQVLHREGQYCYVASALTFDPRTRLARARLYLETADGLGPDADVACSLAVLAAMEGDAPRSLAAWQRAARLDGTLTRERLKNPQVARILERRGIDALAQLDADTLP